MAWTHKQVTYGELMMLCEGHGTSEIYERFKALEDKLAEVTQERDEWHVNATHHYEAEQLLQQQLAAERRVWEEAARVVEGYRLPDGCKMTRLDDKDVTTEWLNRIASRLRRQAAP